MSTTPASIWGHIATIGVLLISLLAGGILVFDIDFDYTLSTVAIGGAVLGMVAGVLGMFAVLRQQSLVGDSLSHSALPGVGIAFLIAGRDLGWLLVGAGIAGWISIMFMTAVSRTTRLKQDTMLGVSLTAFFAAGIAILTYIQSRPDASQAGLDRFIFGQAAAIVRQDVIAIAGVGAICFIVLALFWKEFKLVTFNAEFAQANGYPARMLDIALSTMVVVAVVLGLQIAGVILMVGLLIAPTVAARQWTHNMEQMVILAGIFGAFSGASGAIISGADTGLATGPLIIVVAFVIVVISLAFAPGRGLVWQWNRQRIDRKHFATQNIIRDVYRYAMSHGDDIYWGTPTTFLKQLRGDVGLRALHNLESDGLIRQQGELWQFTQKGAGYAERDAESQRLWQLYRIYADDLHLPHVREDHQQDISAVLPPDAIQKLRAIEV